MVAADQAAMARAAERVRRLAAGYKPPDFAHVLDPDAAVFLCAVDHKTGYTRSHTVDGAGSFTGSELMWKLALRAPPGTFSAFRLRDVTAAEVADLFRTDGETVAEPDRRARLWRDLAHGLERDHGGSAGRLLRACKGRLAGDTGLVILLARYQAYSDPLAKKAFLFAKIAERRGWLDVADPEHWQVSADNVLMRLALRSGLVQPGGLGEVRSATRSVLRELARCVGLSPPVLDDLLWELGRDDPDLLGCAAGNLSEPPRDSDSAWY